MRDMTFSCDMIYESTSAYAKNQTRVIAERTKEPLLTVRGMRVT